jgi:3-oxoacyl-[acyl-carrier-protein] synthase II
MDEVASGFGDYVMRAGRRLEIEYLMSNNFVFGGINTSLIFKRL